MWHPIEENIVISSAESEKARFKFKCRECGEVVITDCISIPVPNFSGDNAEESRVYTEEIVNCPKCEEEHEIQISNDYGGVSASIDGVNANDIFIELC
jgi:hypothetical protein